jgi:hypothetical protein
MCMGIEKFSAVLAYASPFLISLSNRACRLPAHGLTMIFWVFHCAHQLVQTHPASLTAGEWSPLRRAAARRASIASVAGS